VVRGIGPFVLLCGAAALLWVPLSAVRREVLVERAVATFGAALDARLRRTGVCPEVPLSGGGELAQLLLQDGDLAATPCNPDTGLPYGAVDLETDLLFYAPIDGGRGYRLEVLDAEGEAVVAVRVGPGPR
jgi:hypothetical protein